MALGRKVHTQVPMQSDTALGGNSRYLMGQLLEACNRRNTEGFSKIHAVGKTKKENIHVYSSFPSKCNPRQACRELVRTSLAFQTLFSLEILI